MSTLSSKKICKIIFSPHWKTKSKWMLYHIQKNEILSFNKWNICAFTLSIYIGWGLGLPLQRVYTWAPYKMEVFFFLTTRLIVKYVYIYNNRAFPQLTWKKNNLHNKKKIMAGKCIMYSLLICISSWPASYCNCTFYTYSWYLHNQIHPRFLNKWEFRPTLNPHLRWTGDAIQNPEHFYTWKGGGNHWASN